MDNPEKPKHGGKREGSGRKSQFQVKFLVPMTEAQRAKVKLLGGSNWLRAKIDDAANPITGFTGQEDAAMARLRERYPPH